MLPLSVYGSVVMAHSEVSEEYSSQNQFFFYLYDKRNVSNMTCFFFFLLFSPNYFPLKDSSKISPSFFCRLA